MAFAPRTVRNMPDCLQREPMMALQPASMTPEPTNRLLRAELGLAHALGVFLKVVSLDTDLFRQLRIGRNDGTKRGYQIFNLPLIQERVLRDNHPAFLLSLLVGKQFAGQFPEVLSGVIEIDDLNRAGEVLIGNIPDP